MAAVVESNTVLVGGGLDLQNLCAIVVVLGCIRIESIRNIPIPVAAFFYDRFICPVSLDL